MATVELNQNKSHTHTGNTFNNSDSGVEKSMTFTNTSLAGGSANWISRGSGVGGGNNEANVDYIIGSHTHGFETDPEGGTESRPDNIRIYYYVRARTILQSG